MTRLSLTLSLLTSQLLIDCNARRIDPPNFIFLTLTIFLISENLTDIENEFLFVVCRNIVHVLLVQDAVDDGLQFSVFFQLIIIFISLTKMGSNLLECL